VSFASRETRAGASAEPRPRNLTAIVGATLHDGTGRPPIPDSSILIGNGRILNVSRRAEQPLADGTRVIDASGMFVVPGLIDAHVHVGELPHNRFDVDDPEELCDRFLRWFPRHGITTVRDTGSPALDDSLFRLKAGRPEWPRLYCSGPDLDGPPGGPWPGLRVVERPADARAQVAELAESGADFVKIYVWMAPDVLRAVVEEAHGRGLRVAAHVGHVVTVERATRIGVDAFEHVRVGPELLDDEQMQRLLSLPPRRHDHLTSFRPWRFADPASPAAERLIALLAERGAFLTPTLVLSKAILSGNDPDLARAPGVSEMDGAIRRRWEASAYSGDYTDEDWRWAPTEFARQLEFVGLAHRHGVRIAAGTDTPNPFIAPGFSLHQELGLLVRAGLTPMQAINAATQQAARLLNVESEIGTVEKGKRADLVVVNRNPASDITALEDIDLVMKDGITIVPSAR
jgi:imidazolonepropionase-like amidohydrolase